MHNLSETLRSWDFGLYHSLYALGQESSAWHLFFYFFARYGIVLFFSSFIYLIWKKKITAFFCSFLAMGFAAFVDLVILFVWRRPAPYISHADLINITAEGTKMSIASFPSSHTYIAFAIAMSVLLFGHKKLGTVLFLIAISVAIGRVGTGFHYPSDVVGGAFLGMLSGLIAYYSFQKLRKYSVAY